MVTGNNKRRGRGWLDGQATKGWCTCLGWSHDLDLLRAVTVTGAITGVGLAPANVADQDLAETFFAARHTPQPALLEAGVPYWACSPLSPGSPTTRRTRPWARCRCASPFDSPRASLPSATPSLSSAAPYGPA